MYHPNDCLGVEAPLQQATDKVSAITPVGQNRTPDKFPDKLPPVLSGMDKAEALAFVSRLFDAASNGHSLWGDRLLLRRFLSQCSRTNSQETRDGYMRDLRHLTRWRDRHCPDLLIRELDPPMVQNWIDDLRGQVDAGEIKRRTFNRRLSVVSALFRWASEPSRSGVTGIGRNPVPGKSHLVGGKEGKAMSEDDLSKLLGVVASSRDRSARNNRDFVLIRGSYLLGARVSEVARLQWCDVEPLDDGGQIHLLGKGSKARTVRVSADTLQLFESLGRASESDYLFPSSRTKSHLTRQAINYTMRKWGQKAGVDVHPHQLRHSHATHAIRRGCDVFVLAGSLGHASTSTTAHYVAANPKESSSLRLG